jgi:hypothetical protein
MAVYSRPLAFIRGSISPNSRRHPRNTIRWRYPERFHYRVVQGSACQRTTLNPIRRNPHQLRLLDRPIRRHFYNVFPYAVLYVDQPDRVHVSVVMHMMRRPGYRWERL